MTETTPVQPFARPRQLLLAAGASIAAALATALGCALALAVADIYLAGHGQATLGRPWIDRSFVHLSRSDCILCLMSLGAALVAGRAVWRATGRASSRKGPVG